MRLIRSRVYMYSRNSNHNTGPSREPSYLLQLCCTYIIVLTHLPCAIRDPNLLLLSLFDVRLGPLVPGAHRRAQVHFAVWRSSHGVWIALHIVPWIFTCFTSYASNFELHCYFEPQNCHMAAFLTDSHS